MKKSFFVVLLASFLALTGCDNPSVSSGGGGGSVSDIPVEGDAAFTRAVLEAFQVLPYDWQYQVRENTRGIRQAGVNNADWDLWINMDLTKLSRNTAAWRAGIICHESAHHHQFLAKRIPGLDAVQRESEARSWQIACLEAVGAPRSDVEYVRSFGVIPYAGGRSRARVGHPY